MDFEATYTPEQIEKHYQACLDSVNLINGGKLEFMSDKEWEDTVARNKEHLKIMLEKKFWTTQDLTPLKDAVK